MKHLIATLTMVLLLGGCATAHKISSVQLGMTKEEVIGVMGKPTSVSAQGGAEYLNYVLSETNDDAFRGWTKPYYVRLVNGKVESYGRTGDFDSTKTPTVRLESDQSIRQDVQVKGSGDLYTELKKLKELKDAGVITEEEFQAQKKRLLEKQ
jgi:outer membrane protein assembly factor BamE (lipoprotein component of BamABCDE complex)